MGSILRLMSAGAVAAVFGSGFATSARAGAEMWDGSLVITSATAACHAIGENFSSAQSFRALYRGNLKPSDPKAAIIFQTDNLSHIYVVRAQSNTRTMNGTGEYCGIDFDPAIGESTTWLGGAYNFAVKPFTNNNAPQTTINAATTNLQITGTVRKFGNIPGCIVRFRGAFLRRLAP